MNEREDPTYQMLAEQAVEQSRPHSGPMPFGYFGERKLGETDAITFSWSHASEDILNESNFRVISRDLMERFPDDAVVELFGGAWGKIDHLIVTMLDEKGEITEAGKAVLEWREALDAYGIADETAYSELQAEYTEQAIRDYIRYDYDEDWLWDYLESIGYYSDRRDKDEQESLRDWIESIRLEEEE